MRTRATNSMNLSSILKKAYKDSNPLTGALNSNTETLNTGTKNTIINNSDNQRKRKVTKMKIKKLIKNMNEDADNDSETVASQTF
ncbi:hypothetical protein Glove_217g83 [Diversispora epigaea]|uniref:Uncharacterized protein n=1 Tax=Diversispora epigaea TaxID=1348612 RepID=A0A397IJZ1_9GLOM|nr:hypothetical protein Glove_217g83 [Diversispora epigaea]